MSEHLKQITEQLLRNEKCDPFWLLITYQSILQNPTIALAKNPEQIELLNLELIVEEDEFLRVFNPIYEKYFNQNWINEQLKQLRPYYQELNAWSQSEYQDEEQLLTEQELQEALEWVEDKIDYLNLDQELEFLVTSQVLDRFFNKPDFEFPLTDEEIEAIENGRQLVNKVGNPITFMPEIFLWTGNEAFLISKVCQLIIDLESSIPKGEEKKSLQDLIESNLIGNNADSEMLEYRQEISDRILEDKDNAINILKEYQKFLLSPPSSQVLFNETLEQQKLIDLGLLLNQQGYLKLSNLIYEKIFDLNWVEKELPKIIPSSASENNSTLTKTLPKIESLEEQTKASKSYQVIAAVGVIAMFAVGIAVYLFLPKSPNVVISNGKSSNGVIDNEEKNCNNITVYEMIDNKIIPAKNQLSELRKREIIEIQQWIEETKNDLPPECQQIFYEEYNLLLESHINWLINSAGKYEEAIPYICYLSKEFEKLEDFRKILMNWSDPNYNVPQNVREETRRVIESANEQPSSCPAAATININ